MNEIRISPEGHIEIELGRGYVAKCDPDIWESKLKQYNWRPQIHRRGHVYAYASIRGFGVVMHRIVMRVTHRSQIVDHINHDGCDNRRANLRFATPGQNRANSRKERQNESGLKGVSWSKNSRKWTAKICVAGKRHYLGVYAHKERAAMAVDRAALRLHGEFACLNYEHLRDTYRTERAKVQAPQG